MSERFAQEVKAYAALQDLLEHADRVRRMFEQADLNPPAPLARLLGSDPAAEDRMSVDAELWRSASPQPPLSAESDSIPVRLESLSTQSLVLAILRGLGGEAISTADLIAKVRECIPALNAGSVYNIGARLDGSLIQRDGDGWRLTDEKSAPIIEDEIAWGRPEIFTSQEMASYRRERIVEILHQHKSGLMQMQIVDELKRRRCPVPCSKDQVKPDLAQLQEDGIVKKVGNSKKWALVSAA